MNPTRVKDLFLAAAQLPDPRARADFLDRECGADADLRARVEALLRSHDVPGTFLGPPPGAAPAPGESATQTFAVPAKEGEGLTFLAPPGRPDSLGRIGHYEVLEVLGRGGFGIVLRAFDDVLQRVVAVKVLAPEIATTSPARKRFLREARSSAQVRHENVVQIYEIVEHPLPYLVMEYIPGETLQQRIDRTGPLDVPEVLHIGRQMADGLAAAHARGLIHRDVKPANILIEAGPHPRVKLTDFGLARAADDASISQSGVVAGTPMYMAPEQAKGEALDHRADLFSLGGVLYVMCSGRPPFRANNALAVLKRVTEDTPRPIREIIPEVPEWLCRVIGKLHAKAPADRFRTAAEVAEVFGDCERQVQAHGGLRDFSRIPGGRPREPWSRIKRATVTGGLLAATALLFGVVLFKSSIYRYAGNRAEIEFTGGGDPDVEKVLVRRAGDLVATLDRTNPRAAVAPGEYELEVVCIPGYEATKFYVDTTRFLTYTGSFVRATARPAITLTVRRGAAASLAVTAERQPPPAAPARVADGFVSLFNGTDLTGWKATPGDGWRAEDGVIVGRGAASGPTLVSERGDYENFHLRFEAKFSSDLDPSPTAGLFPRWRDEAGAGFGYHGQSGKFTEYRQGGAALLADMEWAAAATRPGACPKDVWHVVEVVTEGPAITLRVNGLQMARGTGTVPRGHLAFQIGLRSTLALRKLEIKEFPAADRKGPPG